MHLTSHDASEIELHSLLKHRHARTHIYIKYGATRIQFYFACIVRCIGLCHYYQGEHNNSEKPEKREKAKD